MRTVRDEEQRQWEPKHKWIVNTIYGFMMGTGIVIVAFNFVFPKLIGDGELTLAEMGFTMMTVLIGLAAALPHIFKQILSAMIRKARNGNGGYDAK